MLNLRIAGALLLAAAPATAQAEEPKVIHTLTWTEVYAGTTVPVSNPNGRLDPGQAALLSVSASFSPPVGTVISYTSPGSGSPGFGPVAGLGSSGFRVNTSATVLGGTWSHLAAASGFWARAAPNFPYGLYGAAAQEEPPPGSLWIPRPDNPVTGLWQIVWTPPTYDHRKAEIWLDVLGWLPGNQPYPSQILVKSEHPSVQYGYRNVAPTFTGAAVTIPIIPAPGTAALLGTALLLLGRRSRSREQMQ